MTSPGTPDSTARLLDGALVAGEQVAMSAGRPSAEMTRLRHAWNLVASYHTTHATPRIMSRARERFEGLGRSDLAAFAYGKVVEETGHDELALADLRALGYDAEALVDAVVPADAAALVAAEERVVEGAQPLASIGYAYAIERSSTRIGASYVRALDEILGPGVYATRCLRVHSALGADVGHVESAVRFIAGLPAAERTQIAAAVYEAALLFYGPHERQHPTERELAVVLGPYGASSC
jgi:pyrroloquinoline quinone (PQQ) biosynthesis protein C